MTNRTLRNSTGVGNVTRGLTKTQNSITWLSFLTRTSWENGREWKENILEIGLYGRHEESVGFLGTVVYLGEL